MKKKKVLNCYAGVGGNRKDWENVDVTAVEINQEIAEIYKDFYPDDTVIIGDAHEYLLKHYSEFDFIWSSPPCQTHTKLKQLDFNIPSRASYPDMKLWQEIVLLEKWFCGKWIVENVNPYYKPPTKPSFKLGRHPVWCNFYIPQREFPKINIRKASIKELYKFLGIKLDKKIYIGKSHDYRQILKNCVHPDIGKWILDCAFKTESYKQETLF